MALLPFAVLQFVSSFCFVFCFVFCCCRLLMQSWAGTSDPGGAAESKCRTEDEDGSQA